MKIDAKIAAIPPKYEEPDNIDTDRGKQSINAASPDSRMDELVLSKKYPKLTDEQIDYLKGKYDVEHIGNEQLGKLIDDLANMGVMDGKYKLFAYETIAVPEYSGYGIYFSPGEKLSERENPDSDEGNLLKRMDKKLEQANANLYSTPEAKDLISYFISLINLIKR